MIKTVAVFLLIASMTTVSHGSFMEEAEVGFNCADPIHCSGFGICASTSDRCFCDQGYHTDPSLPNQCNSYVPLTDHHWRKLTEVGESTNSDFNCTFAPVDCSNHGVCNLARDGCICEDAYATHEPPFGKQCNYERKNHWVAFGWAWISWASGAAYWYTEYYIHAAILLSLGPAGVLALWIVFGCIGGFTSCICFQGDKENPWWNLATPLGVLNGLTMVSALVWGIVVMFQMGLNSIPDGNGVEMC